MALSDRHPIIQLQAINVKDVRSPNVAGGVDYASATSRDGFLMQSIG